MGVCVSVCVCVRVGGLIILCGCFFLQSLNVNNAIKMWLWNLYLIWATGFFFCSFTRCRFYCFSSHLAESNGWKKLPFFLRARELFILFSFALCVCVCERKCKLFGSFVQMWCFDRRISINSTQCICSHFIIHAIAVMVKCQFFKALPNLNVSKTIIPFNSNRREMRFRYKSNLLYAHTIHLSCRISQFLWLERKVCFWYSI